MPRTVSRPTLYAVLQVDPRAETEIIESAFRRLAQKYHPDVSDDPTSEARMRELNAAYAVLRDPVRRAEYDAQLGGRAPRFKRGRAIRHRRRSSTRSLAAWGQEEIRKAGTRLALGVLLVFVGAVLVRGVIDSNGGVDYQAAYSEGPAAPGAASD